tara:strand:+ start:216 stop:698 length:483 start_codon:yes stop_codon:yes gene_type:complete
MATGSVFNWDTLKYDYFQIPGKANLGGFDKLDGLGISKAAVNGGEMGIDIEDALPQLPLGSKRVGSGTQAKGRIYRPLKTPLSRMSPRRIPSRALAGLGAHDGGSKLVSNPVVPALLAASTTLLVSRFIPKDKELLALLFFFGLTTGLGIGMHHSKWEHE